MRIVDFQFINPGEQTTSFIFNSTGSAWTVKQVNISVNDSANNNLFDVLQNVTSLAFTFDNVSYSTTVLSRIQRANFFHYEVEDFVIPSGSTVTAATKYETTLVPGPDVTGFQNSEFEVLISNATATRTNTHIYEVDRSSQFIIPGNYNNIVSESAEYADVPDSNYTSQGIINSRYAGAKTSTEDFGVEPLIGGTLFEGASYLLTSSNNFICSQSLEDRTLEDLLFSITASAAQDSEVPIVDSKIFQLEGSKILPIKNSKVWVKSNTSIIQTDQNGIVQSTITQCTVD